MRIAYLINQYPKVSHSFIRREIQALERQHVKVMRIAMRGWDHELVEADDQAERSRTQYVLRCGAMHLLLVAVMVCFLRPIRAARALALEFRMSRHSERSIIVHLIYFVEACKVLLWLQREKIVHLHAHFGTNSAEVAMIAHMLGGPAWSFTVHGPEEFDKAQFINLAEKVRRARFVVAVSSYGRSQLYRLAHHKCWSKIHVVHCGLDDAFLDAAADRTPLPTRLVCLGRICEQKGQLLLVEAARTLATRGVDFELVLAGDGDLRPVAEQLIQEHGLGDKIRITGWIDTDQVKEELLAARALILPSFAEGLPVAIMEAMALRRPVISTYIAGIPELVHCGEHGWLVPAGNIESLTQAIETCLKESDEQIRAKGDAARSRTIARHNVHTEAAKLVNLFRAVHAR